MRKYELLASGFFARFFDLVLFPSDPLACVGLGLSNSGGALEARDALLVVRRGLTVLLLVLERDAVPVPVRGCSSLVFKES